MALQQSGCRHASVQEPHGTRQIRCDVPVRLQDTPGSNGCITFQQFSRLVRLPIPLTLSKSAALARDMLVAKFINKLKAAVALRREQQLSPPSPSQPTSLPASVVRYSAGARSPAGSHSSTAAIAQGTPPRSPLQAGTSGGAASGSKAGSAAALP